MLHQSTTIRGESPHQNAVIAAGNIGTINAPIHKSMLNKLLTMTSPTQVGENVMGCFPSSTHDPLDAPRGVPASLPTPSATVGPVVSAAPSDKRACASVAPPIINASAQRLANAIRAARTDNAARPNHHVAISAAHPDCALRADPMPSTSAPPLADPNSAARAHSNARADPAAPDKVAAIGLASIED